MHGTVDLRHLQSAAPPVQRLQWYPSGHISTGVFAILEDGGPPLMAYLYRCLAQGVFSHVNVGKLTPLAVHGIALLQQIQLSVTKQGGAAAVKKCGALVTLAARLSSQHYRRLSFSSVANIAAIPPLIHATSINCVCHLE